MKETDIQISISIVSHNHASLVMLLLQDLHGCISSGIEVLVTLNTDEPFPANPEQYPFPLTIIRNEVRKGFGANHNAAFEKARGEYFCVLNPDVRFVSNPFPDLLQNLHDPKLAIAAPKVVNPDGKTEDSARPYPTLLCIIKKALGYPQCSRYPNDVIPSSPDWVAGMFMLIRSSAYRELKGFNTNYFMYYEDVEICARARLMGWDIVYQTNASVIHDARRDSHRKIRFLIWHVSSMLRFMTSGLARKTIKMKHH